MRGVIWVFLAMLIAARAHPAALPPLSPEARSALAGLARDILSGKTTAIGSETLASLPKELRATNVEHLYVTLFTDRAPAVRFGARKKGLVEATFGAMAKARTLASFDFYNYGNNEAVTLLFERVTDETTLPPARWFPTAGQPSLLSYLKLGVEGLEIVDGDRDAVLPPGEAFLRDMDNRDLFIQRLCSLIHVYPVKQPVMPAEWRLWDKTKTSIKVLSFETFLSRPRQVGAVELYRMNDLNVAPWKDETAVARRLGEAIVRQQHADGRFAFAFSGRALREDTLTYNVATHGYAVTVLLELAQRTGDKSFVAAAGKGVDWAAAQLRKETPAKQPPMMYVVYEEKARLGDSAMTAVALAKYGEATRSKQHDATLRLIGNFLVAQQYDDGSFLHYYRYDNKVPYTYHVSGTFPGQATWALACLHQHFKEESWLTAARKSADWLVKDREKVMKWTEPPADLWLAAAIREMVALRDEPAYVDYVRRMADASVRQQKVKDAPPDMIGSFEGEGEGSVLGTAGRAGLLGRAWAIEKPKSERAAAYADALVRALAFIRLNEIRPSNAFFLSEPEKLYGMVRANSFRNDLRLDATCHVIEALLWKERIDEQESKR